jgi:hypothetical protein
MKESEVKTSSRLHTLLVAKLSAGWCIAPFETVMPEIFYTIKRSNQH